MTHVGSCFCGAVRIEAEGAAGAMDAVSGDGPAAGEFLAALRRAVDVGEGLEVVVSGGLSGIAYCHPDDYGGEIDIRWDWSGRATPSTGARVASSLETIRLASAPH